MGYGNGYAEQAVGLGGAYIGETALAQKRMPLIQEALMGQDKRIEELHAALSMLEERLTPVMQNVPTGEPAGAATPDPNVPLVSALNGSNRRLEAAVNRVRRLIDRLEL